MIIMVMTMTMMIVMTGALQNSCLVGKKKKPFHWLALVSRSSMRVISGGFCFGQEKFRLLPKP